MNAFRWVANASADGMLAFATHRSQVFDTYVHAFLTRSQMLLATRYQLIRSEVVSRPSSYPDGDSRVVGSS